MDKMLSKSEQVGKLYADMSQELLMRMIHRIKQRGVVDLETDPYLWHLDKLRDMHALNEANIKYVVEQTGIAREVIDNVLKHEGLVVYEDSAKRISKDTGKPLPNYNGVKDTLSAYASQAFLDVDNLVNQTLLSRNVDTNPVMRVYQDILTKSVSDVVNGLRSPEQAVNRAVMDWVNKGIPSGFVDKAGRTWSIESYVNSVMTSTTYRVYNEMRTESAKDLGVDTFHMSAHSAARPNCAPIQGHIVTTGHGFESKHKDIGYVYSLSDYGYGRPDGTLGINCRHVLTPFVIGVNELPDEDIPSVKDAIANGKKQAQQRSFERGIRDAKKQLSAAKALGDDKLIARYRDLLHRRQGGLNQLLSETARVPSKSEKISIKSKNKDVFSSSVIKKMNEAYSNEQLKVFKNGFNPVNEDITRAINNFIDGDVKLLPHTTEGRSYFSGGKNSEMLVKDANARAFYHEIGHGIDYMAHKDVNTGIYDIRVGISEMVRNDLDNTVYRGTLLESKEINRRTKVGKARYKEIWEEQQSYRKEFQSFLDDEKFTPKDLDAITDILGGAKFRFDTKSTSLGHSDSYWQNESSLGEEAIAHMFSAMARQSNDLEILRKYLPDTYKFVEKLIKKK